MENSRPRTLRPSWPFRRVAVVLSGGGALGAYEIGVLKVLESVGLRPAILAGVSVGAINAVVWLAHGFRTAELERAWRNLRGSAIGMRWSTLALRAAGVFIVMLALIEFALTLAGVSELNVRARFRRLEDAMGFEVYSILFESLAWLVVGAAGVLMTRLAVRLEDALARFGAAADPERWQRWLGRGILGAAALYAVATVAGLPWPWRFHAVLMLAGGLVWVANRPGRPREWLRRLFLRLMPETRGRGLWRGGARRRLIERLVQTGDPARLTAGDPHLIISACALNDGRVSYFVNWSGPPPEFLERMREALGDVVEVLRPADVIEATVASCAVPVLFEPVRFRGHDYLDGGVFSNQPLRAVVADGADAILTVLVSPSGGPREPRGEWNVVELGARLQELSSWRDVQAELRLLPPGWSRDGDPARLCVVEPERPLPGRLFGFDPEKAAELIRMGERDAQRALERAGWLAA